MGWFKVAQVIGSKGSKKISETITSLKGKYNVGSADKIKSKAAKAKLESAKFNLDRTFSKVDKSIKKLEKSVKKTGELLGE